MTCNQLHKIIVAKIVAFYMILELLFWELQEAIFLCLAAKLSSTTLFTPWINFSTFLVSYILKCIFWLVQFRVIFVNLSDFTCHVLTRLNRTL